MSVKPHLTTKDIALIGMMIATIEIAKRALAFLPNVELVTLLVILYTLYFGKRIFAVIPAFILLECTMYGFGLWWLMYLYVWPLLACLTLLFRKQESVWFWSILSGAFGLAFSHSLSHCGGNACGYARHAPFSHRNAGAFPFPYAGRIRPDGA